MQSRHDIADWVITVLMILGIGIVFGAMVRIVMFVNDAIKEGLPIQ